MTLTPLEIIDKEIEEVKTKLIALTFEDNETTWKAHANELTILIRIRAKMFFS